MHLERMAPEGRQLIQSYRPGGFKVGGAQHEGALLVCADRTVEVAVAGVDELVAERLPALLALVDELDLLLVGTGSRADALPAELRVLLKAHHVAVEPMATPAACRTYNLLQAEDRRVAALVLPVD
jgi:uncharacterized protein